MRRSKHAMIEEARARASRMGRASQAARRNERLAAVVEFDPRPASTMLLQLATWNPIRQRGHYLELVHEIGSGRFVVYLDGERWRNGWSASRFGRWMAGQIDRAREDWS